MNRPMIPVPRPSNTSEFPGPDQRRWLGVLAKYGEGHSRGIARLAGTRPGHSTRTVQALLKRGLIEESPEAHPSPSVKIQYRLTESGRAAAARAGTTRR